jgi:SAM-dependent methyltransferase
LAQESGIINRLKARVLDRLAGGRRPGLDPPVGRVSFGDLRRLEPISRRWGYDRGRPVDRYYIERFLARSADAISGRVLEIGDNRYTREFGGTRVSRSDVLHVTEGNPKATIVGDLSRAGHIPSNSFDCIILCQTLQLIYDPAAALATIHRILAPGGVALATFPGITQMSDAAWRDQWYWSFTSVSARRLFGGVFGDEFIEVRTHGNVLAAVSFLEGLAAEELSPGELDHNDPEYECLITVQATRRRDVEAAP